MNRLIFLPVLALSLCLAGCLSHPPPVPVNWTIEWRQPAEPSARLEALPLTLRVADIHVRAPYAGLKLAVLRGNGSIAFDSYNVFAASPEQLLRGAAFDALERSGRFAHVVDHASGAHADLEAEIIVTRLALDCRMPERREALVELSLAFVAKNAVVAVAHGASAVAVEDGNYSEGFSRAFSEALVEASLSLKADAVKR